MLAPRAMSLEQKLPLLVGALLVGVTLTLSIAAWREVRDTAQSSAAQRLSNVTTQLGENFHQSVVQLRERIVPDAARPAIASFAGNAPGSSREAALDAMRQVTAQPTQVLATELRDASGRTILSTAPAETLLTALPLADVIPSTEPGGGPVVGTFKVVRDTLVYPVATPVPGSPDVYLVRWRRMVGSRSTRELLTQLVGSGASIYIGNARGEGWSDLERPVLRPEFSHEPAGAVREYGFGSDRRMISTLLIPGSPWMVAVGFPSETVLAPVNAFVGRMAIIAAFALALALLVTWLISRRITRPITQLTLAAEGIAAGRYGDRVTLNSDDELGRLARSFSHMSTEVQRSRETLEDQVRERTRELSEAQEALVRRERLALLGQLSSGVGHELRNPLGVMTNSVYFLRTVLRDAPAKVGEYLDIIQQQINLSEKIVSDLLDFARQRAPQRKRTPVIQLVETQVGRLGPRDGVRVTIETIGTLPDMLADPVQAGQIVFNMLTNAVQALDSGGNVMLRARAVGSRIEIQVADDGPGVAPENRERVFEPLFTTKARGIGLGLAVSRTMARANGGELALRTDTPVGATFVLTLDAAIGALSEAEQLATPVERS